MLSKVEIFEKELGQFRQEKSESHREFRERLGDIDKDIEYLKISVAKKVNWWWFFGVLLSIGGIQFVAWSAVWSEVKAIRGSAEDTRNTVYQIRGQLEPFNFIIDDSE